MTSRLNGAGVISGNGVPTADMFPRATSDGTPLYLDLDDGLLYYLDDSNDVQTINTGLEPFGVGAIYLSIDSTNPNTTLGYGTWVRFSEGRMLIGLDENNALFDTPEETGGFADAIVVEHTHTQNPHTHTQNAHNHNQRYFNFGSGNVSYANTASTVAGSNNQTQANSGLTTASETAVNQNTTAVNQSTGISGANRNYPPFITVYMWKRTA